MASVKQAKVFEIRAAILAGIRVAPSMEVRWALGSILAMLDSDRRSHAYASARDSLRGPERGPE